MVERRQPSTSILVVAGSELVAARVEAMLRGESGLRVAVSGLVDLAHRIDDHEPAIVVLALPPPDVARALENLRGLPSLRAVVLASDPGGAWTAQARRAGVRAVLRGDATKEELVAAIAAARAGLVVLHPDALKSPAAARAAPQGGGAAALTPREVEILGMMAEGMSNRTIAARLGISSHTVKFHVASILEKLGAGSRTEAVTFGVRQGLIAL
ncbi:MAG TPA: response regulator transcription factor [Candidatus Binatia bacterium]|nr:response regulator transcription factor [Candidatus Binatia bacterium]